MTSSATPPELTPHPTLSFEPSPASEPTAHILIGRKEALLSAGELLPSDLDPALWAALVEGVKPGDFGAAASTLFSRAGAAARATAIVLPEVNSRHNSPVRSHAIAALVGAPAAEAAADQGVAAVTVLLEDQVHASAAACAVARAFPLYTSKHGRGAKALKAKPGTVSVRFASGGGAISEAAVYARATRAAAGVRLAARLVDTPAEELGTLAFVAEAEAAAARLAASGAGVSVEVVQGEALRDGGFGGIWNVGRAAVEPPAMVVMSYSPEGATTATALVGKGIVYDTGGLGLKSKEGMCGMKMDMGGAAALLGAFEAAVASGYGEQLHLVLCLAENAIGAKAFRHDDIVRLLSGNSCEINNTDAEGRLVLADGVAYASCVPPRLLCGASFVPSLIIDMATLTGAQMVATGKRHAALVCDDAEVEARAIAAGRASGDLAHALPFCPEFYRSEFKSKVADMKNSVKDRGNAQASCAATFVYEQLHPDYEGAWLHVDMAGPAFAEDRATGYGVALVLALLKVEGFA